MLAAFKVTLELLLIIVHAQMIAEAHVSKDISTALDIAFELHGIQPCLNVFRQFSRLEWSLAIGTGAFGVALCPGFNAVGTEQMRAICACLCIIDDFCAHHADESVVNLLSHCLFLF